MDAKALRATIKGKYRSVRAFSEVADIKYSTLMTYLDSDEKLENMTLPTFRKVCAALEMTMDELFEVIDPTYTAPKSDEAERLRSQLREIIGS